jgi:hypothetical protein
MILQCASSACYNSIGRYRDLLTSLDFHSSKSGLAILFKDLKDRLPRHLLNDGICVYEFPIEALSQQPPDGRFASTWRPGKHNVQRLQTELPIGHLASPRR